MKVFSLILLLVCNFSYLYAQEVEETDGVGANRRSDGLSENDSLSNSTGIAEKRGLTGDPNWDKVAKAFRETVIRSFLQFDAVSPAVSKLFVAHPAGIVTIWIITIMEMQEQEISAWDAVQEKTEMMISERMTDNNLALIQSDFDLIQARLEKSRQATNEKFGKEDLRFIRGKASRFFPQTYPNDVWNLKWASVIWKYLVILAGSYLDLIGSGVFTNKCQLAEELDELRPSIIEAAKKLVKGRYKNLGKIDNGGDRRDIYHSIKGDPAYLSFDDIAEDPGDKRYHGKYLTHVKSGVLDAIKQAAAEDLNVHLVKNFNSLYNETWVPSNCNPKGPIRMNEIEFTYPAECMGTKKDDENKECTLPCGNYGGKFKMGQNWCPLFPKHKIENNFEEDEFWDWIKSPFIADCNLPEWDVCMPTKRLPQIDWTPDDYDKKKKKKKKAMRKGKKTSE